MIRRDDRQAFSELYNGTFAMVIRALRRFGIAEEALDDVVQDVFLTAYRQLPTFEGRSTISTWIYGIARRVAADHRRNTSTRARRETPTEGVSGAPSQAADPFEQVLGAERAVRLATMLGELDPARREVLILADIEGMSGPEIADALELPLETAYGRLRKARGEFEEVLRRYRARDLWLECRGELAGSTAGARGDERRRNCWVAIAAGLDPSGGSAQPSAAGSSSWQLWGGFGVGAVSAGAIALLIALRTGSTAQPPRAAIAPRATEAVLAPPPAAPRVRPLAEAAPNPASPSSAPESPASSAPASSSSAAAEPRSVRRPRRSPAAAERDTLAAEVQLLHGALDALRAGQFDDAQHRVAEHRRRFPRGALTTEREALKVAIRCAREPGSQAEEARRFTAEIRDPALARVLDATCSADGDDVFDPDR